MTADNRVVNQLRGVAAKLTYNVELQKDLLQEMFIHLVRVEEEMPGHTPSWYIKSCEFHARNYLKHGRSIDSLKRANNLIPLGQCYEDVEGHVFCFIDVADPLDALDEVMTKDVVDLVMPRLNEMQQEILLSLLNGMGVREIARELGVSHPAVIKHRRKIARIANEFIRESETDLVTMPCRGEGAGTISQREPSSRHSSQLAVA